MSNPKEMQEFIDMMNRVEKVYGTLPNKAAIIAVNFSKERFKQQNWLGNTTKPWKKRKRTGTKDDSRAILVKSGALKRDVHKIMADSTKAIIGTSNITGNYARIHNEGFRGSVSVKEFRRKHYTHAKEKYTTRSGRERTRTKRTINSNMETTVRSHIRKVNIPARQFLGSSPVLDTRIEKMMTAEFIKAIR